VGVPTEISLFSGAGGGLLGSKWLLGWRTVCYVEWNKYAIEVLKARIRDGWLDDAPIWDDAFTFDGRPWRGLVDVVSAGFPCQPFSLAGKGLAENDPRNGWPATIRIIREVRPRVAWLENVPGLLSKPYFGTILGELAEAGYDARWECVAAEEIGANHRRERLWILATDSIEREGYVAEQPREEGTHVARNGASQQMADADRSSSKGNERAERSEAKRADIDESSWWSIEPRVGRVADGVAHRVDRLATLGNGQVPDVVAEAWRRLCR